MYNIVWPLVKCVRWAVVSFFNIYLFFFRFKYIYSCLEAAHECPSSASNKFLEDFLKYLQLNTGKSMSEALILASTNPQYENRLFIELPLQYMKIPSSEHGENMRTTWQQHDVHTNCFLFLFRHQYNLCKQHILPIFWAWNFHALNW